MKKEKKQEESKRLKQDIDEYKEKVEVKNLSVVVEQSKTKDNLMDYNHDKDGNKVSSFEYKTLRKWQWNIITTSAHSNYNNYLKNKTND